MHGWLASEFARFAAVAVLPAGCAFLARGVHIWWIRSAAGERGTGDTLLLARGLRAVLVGGALIACAVGVLLESSVLFAIGAAVGAEELLETSAVIFALRDDLAGRTLSENAR